LKELAGLVSDAKPGLMQSSQKEIYDFLDRALPAENL
jgi:hypothetical protein